VRSVLEDCDREDNDGSETDDCECDCFSVSDHNSVTEEGDDDGKPEKTRNIASRVENIPEYFESDVEEEVQT
jgi:hypothetical protein